METQFKVGQRVMILGTVNSLKDGVLVNLNNSSASFGFHPNGKYYSSDEAPSLLPYTEPFKEREMMACDDNMSWVKTIIVSNINGRFQSKASDGFGIGHNWRFAKEIEEPKPEKLTQEEIKAQIKELAKQLK